MIKNIISLIFAVIAIIYSLISGVHGIKNKKAINNPANLILSIGQVAVSIILITGIIILIYMGKLKLWSN